MDIRTLQYWHKLEHFYPYLLQDQKSPNIKTFVVGAGQPFPCFEHPCVEPGKEVRGYCVYLGIFRVEPALRALEEGIGRKMAFRDCGEDESCFCMFRLAPDGTFLPHSFQISSFPWAIHRVRDGKIQMDQWDENFFQFQKQIFEYLNARSQPVDSAFLNSVRDLFAELLNWTLDYADHWLRIDMILGREPQRPAGQGEEQGAQEEDEEEIQSENEATDEQIRKNDLLNSFYIRDLERVIETVSADEASCGQALRGFLFGGAQNRVDIEHDGDALFALMSPEALPKGRWPSDYGARLMQQVDVNAFLNRDPAYQQPIFSVNGPPGTGKTTLLKDVVAAIVTARGDLLMELEEPDQAFERTRLGSISVGTYENYIWNLRPEFSQFGILVASNNNGAVENITHGLPGRADLPKRYDTPEHRYFSGVSDRLLGQDKTWALNAAALGNKRNRRTFAEAFWPLDREEDPYNFRLALQEAVKKRTPQQWHTAQAAYRERREAVEAELRRAQEIYRKAEELRRLGGQEVERRLKAVLEALPAARQQLDQTGAELERMREKQGQIQAELDGIRRDTPFLGLKQIFLARSPAVVRYRQLQAERERIAYQELPHLKEVRQQQRQSLEQLEQERRKLELERERRQAQRAQLTQELEAFRGETGMPFRVDEYFEDCGAGEHSKSSPWGYPRLNELREQLFLAALDLHASFVQGSRCMKDNLDGFSKVLRGMITPDQAKRFTVPLFQSFFLMVPVISTTFASVGSFLRDIPAQEIAYLFIDEAGQAVPQSAAGAIWRARHVIAVGDPLQIEPVVTLHDSIIASLGRHFGQTPLMMDKYTSVQSLGDRANRIGGWRTLAQENDLWIGAPLLVHSRCQLRAFQIANRIAYNDKMIFATRQRGDAVCRWLDVTGASQAGHYVPAQAQAALALVARAFAAFAQEGNRGERNYPSLFVITPFRSTRAGLAQYFRRELPLELERAGAVVDRRCVRSWVSDCIGTIHTFQGKEADTVLLCLGVDSGGKGTGAVDWAGERPNILNVAVTRSKRALYIIGDRRVWCRKSYFQDALDRCEDVG